MARMRSLLVRSPGVTALVAMVALLAVVWGAPEVGAPHLAIAQSHALA